MSTYFYAECITMKRSVVAAFKANIHTPTDANKARYEENKRQYKRLKRQKSREHDKAKVRQMLHDKRHDSRKFWQMFGWKKKSSSVAATRQGLHEHFSTLYDNPDNNIDVQWQEFVQSYNKWWLNSGPSNESDILDCTITEEEVERSIRNLKSGKAAGIDSVPAEFLKNSIDIISPILAQLFNKIFETGTFPLLWQRQLLTAIYKKGDDSDPSNYRGVSLISIVSKVFLGIIYLRIEKFCTSKNLLVEEQGGFRKGRWTIDNAFVLHCHVKAALSNKGHLYTLFVDYSKCFDLIGRDFLWYKLIKLGFSKKLVKLLMSIYSKVGMHLKYDRVIGPEINSTIGLKQGCPLSTILFALFTNDIVTSISQELTLEERAKRFMLLFADDMILFTSDPNKMARMIIGLEKYTSNWGMKVNIQKTKLILFRKAKLNVTRLLVDFKFKDQLIEYVDHYKYLGLFFHFTGSWNMQITEAKTKGQRACYLLREKLKNTASLPVKEVISLYKTCVQSALLFGSEIWGSVPIDTVETVQNNFSKYILGVRQSTPNLGALGELGLLPYKRFKIYRIIKYWVRIISERNSLLLESYSLLKKCKGATWNTFVRENLENLGFGIVWINQNVENSERFLNELLIRLKDTYIQEYDEKVKDLSRLSVLNSININPCTLSPYLRLPISRFIQKKIAQYRLSSHRLKIETGRWSTPITPRDERICEFCNANTVDDEIHFIFECKLEEIESLRRIHLNVNTGDKREQLINLLSTEHPVTLRHLGLFFKEAEAVRKQLTS